MGSDGLDGSACLWITGISGLVYLIIGAVWDYFRYFMRLSPSSVLPSDECEDEDVKKARQIAESAQPNDFSILLKNVRKEFKEKVADRNVSLAFPQSSCFALLGPNGAGKSTLVNMLTGQLRPNNGRVYIMGTAMSGQKANVFRRACMSLCMQDDTVLKSLTPRQHLMILHRTRCNCSLAKARVDVQRALEGIGLAKYADQAIGTLSGGNCRKLSVATTMLPMTRVMVFDEPSTGMDPVTRRLMWTAIDQHKSGRCLLLTTHSMEEAEAVSDCIGIIAHGEMQCIGSVQHLRAKFNQNYHLSIDLRPDAQQDATAELVKAIVGDQSPALSPVPTSTPPSPGSLSGALWSLVESVGTRRTYELKVVPSMSGLFRLMESEKERFMIQSYSVAQASLEDIFLQLVRREEALENPHLGTYAPLPLQSQMVKPVQQQCDPVPASVTVTTTAPAPYMAQPAPAVQPVADPYMAQAAPAVVQQTVDPSVAPVPYVQPQQVPYMDPSVQPGQMVSNDAYVTTTTEPVAPQPDGEPIMSSTPPVDPPSPPSEEALVDAAESPDMPPPAPDMPPPDVEEGDESQGTEYEDDVADYDDGADESPSP